MNKQPTHLDTEDERSSGKKYPLRIDSRNRCDREAIRPETAK